MPQLPGLAWSAHCRPAEQALASRARVACPVQEGIFVLPHSWLLQLHIIGVSNAEEEAALADPCGQLHAFGLQLVPPDKNASLRAQVRSLGWQPTEIISKLKLCIRAALHILAAITGCCLQAIHAGEGQVMDRQSMP